MRNFGMKAIFAAALALIGVWSGDARAQDHCTPIALAQGATSATVTGTAAPDATTCYTVAPAPGQIAHVTLTGANAVVAISAAGGKELGHARADWTFTTRSPGYTLTVSQRARAPEPQAFSLSIATSAKPHCGIARLDLCAYGNSLANDPDFRAEVAQFLGTRRGIYVNDGPVVDQMFDVLGSHPDSVVPVNGLYRFTACRQRDCADKGAAVVDLDGQVVALGIIYGTCIRHVPDCMGDRRLTVFIRQPETMGWVIDDLADWAKAAAAQTNMVAGPMPELRGVSVVPVD